MDGKEHSTDYGSGLGKPSSGAPWLIALAALIVLAGGAGAWWYLHRTPAPAAAPVAETSAAPKAAPVPAANLAEGDALLRAAAPSLSSAKELADWLAQGDILRRLVAAVNLIAEGKSPRPMLGFVAPAGAFEIVTRDRATYAAEANGVRYEHVVGVLTSIDVAAAARTYQQLRPFIQAAYAEMAPPQASFDEALHQSLQSLAATPLPKEPPKLIAKGALYAFADPKLEALTPAQKHLLRLGDKNARAVQGWLKALDESLVPAPR